MDELPPTPEKKLRKGTHSCWECKRRKRRCTFAGVNSRSCTGCQRRGIACIGQEVPEAQLPPRKGRWDISEQLDRLENILHDVMDKVNREESDKTGGEEMASVAETETAAAGMTTAPSPPVQTAQALTSALLAAFPSRKDYQTLIAAGHFIIVSFYRLNTGKKTDIKREDYEAEASTPPSAVSVPPMPDASVHPVLLARQMMYWALFLQSPWHYRHCIFEEDARGLMERLVAAVRRVNGNDDLHGSLESLECMMLEAQFHLHGGNLRRAWVVNRRAMLLAQLMGVHRAGGSHLRLRILDSRNVYQPEAMWARVVFLDRFLCLLLGLPQGNSEIIPSTPAVAHPPMPPGANENPVLRLERALSGIAARILERNERGLASARLGPEHDSAVLDAELLRVAQGLPAEFWQLPRLDGVQLCSFEDSLAASQLLVQVSHFHLLNQLHLPYMLSFIRASSTSSASSASSASPSTPNDYAAISCSHASREILQRFVAYRRFNHACLFFRPVDFTALTAVLTLLLAHLDAHLAERICRANTASSSPPPPPSMARKLLAHQRLGDRALLEQVLERLDVVSRYNRDAMSIESARMMRSLLAIEAQAAGDGSKEGAHCEGDPILQITIPYFGAVCITWDGRISKVFPADDADDDSAGIHHLAANTDVTHSYWAKRIDRAPEGVFSDDVASAAPPFQPTVPLSMPSITVAEGHPNSWGPAITAGTDDWAFQGVDMAFFDNLMMDPAGQNWQGGHPGLLR